MIFTIKGVLFDFDGVLIPIDIELKRKFKEEIIKKLSREQATHLDQILFKSAYVDPYLKIKDAARQLGLQDSQIDELFHQISKEKKIMLEKKMIDMLCKLKGHCLILGIVTISNKERIERILQDNDVKSFDFIESASKEFIESPNSHGIWKKTAYQRSLDKYKIQASEVLCVGDTPIIDLTPAKSLGIKTVLVIHDDNRELEQKCIADNVLYRDTLYKTFPVLVLDIDRSITG